jgi:hypothetical protein
MTTATLRISRTTSRLPCGGHTVEAAPRLTSADGGPLCAAIPPHLISWRVLDA